MLSPEPRPIDKPSQPRPLGQNTCTQLSSVYVMALGAPAEARLCHGGGWSSLVRARGRRAAAGTTRGGRTHQIQIDCPRTLGVSVTWL